MGTTVKQKSQANNALKNAEQSNKPEMVKPKHTAPLLTVPTRKHRVKEIKKENIKVTHNVKVKGWDDESLIYDDRKQETIHKKSNPERKKQNKKKSKGKDSSISKLSH